MVKFFFFKLILINGKCGFCVLRLVFGIKLESFKVVGSFVFGFGRFLYVNVFVEGSWGLISVEGVWGWGIGGYGWFFSGLWWGRFFFFRLFFKCYVGVVEFGEGCVWDLVWEVVIFFCLWILLFEWVNFGGWDFFNFFLFWD